MIRRVLEAVAIAALLGVRPAAGAGEPAIVPALEREQQVKPFTCRRP